MPASTLEPLNGALRNSFSKSSSDNNLDVQISGTSKKALLSIIEFEPAGNFQSAILDKLKNKYIVLKQPDTHLNRYCVFNAINLFY